MLQYSYDSIGSVAEVLCRGCIAVVTVNLIRLRIIGTSHGNSRWWLESKRIANFLGQAY